jgi:hypothetical protein
VIDDWSRNVEGKDRNRRLVWDEPVHQVHIDRGFKDAETVESGVEAL